ncbi:hypothetical protein GALMADRAFT_149157 [Galerina marginata CBS 339.88]|uniref:Uncharacterized protein n=1 Tax=Galerina marginata (strain CBS 339.88) TaxID=685588 RepID=A0A067S2B2_GALM3|nr:hypothetical protein GALMADRAFT_149157 [Galerina marginata CBS 339.88]
MDQFYDMKATESKVERLAENQVHKQKQLCYFNATDGIKDQVEVVPLEQNKTWKLIRNPTTQDAEEVVLRIQGVLSQKSLPPISQTFNIEPKQRHFMRQSATLSGLGSALFNQAIQNAQDIHQMFSRTFPQGALEDWNPAMFEGHPAIDMNNRFFTLRKQAIMDEIIPFSNEVDPHGILAAAMGADDQFVHTTENEVEYYELLHDHEQEIRYQQINPIKFRCGDIVEAQLSFICIQMKNAKYRMLTVLRAITILDTSSLREAAIARNRTKNQTVRQVSLKRKVGYATDEVVEARDRLSRMKLKD